MYSLISKLNPEFWRKCDSEKREFSPLPYSENLERDGEVDAKLTLDDPSQQRRCTSIPHRDVYTQGTHETPSEDNSLEEGLTQ